ncbi:GxxExxY protein [Candidatus Cloacimonas acidaminovorans]|jgi:GxxExxY protein|uniref:GxxExxY protein n=1 Tax=Candidatus Cloacimonas acidaminovorans TaxID=456827 RepID=UPI0005C535FB|nr:GxxExxY protein [Candidatus Cloacimonas acidaminovorans]
MDSYFRRNDKWLFFQEIIFNIFWTYLVNEQVIMELKSVETLLPVHHKQLITYLKLAKKPLGFLINFNTDSIKDNIIRIANDKNHPDLK